MSVRDLFKKTKADKVVSSKSLAKLGKEEVESAGFIKSSIDNKNRTVPYINFKKPDNFVHYGSAEKYYSASIHYIRNEYPYDGSLKEKLEWDLSSSYLDKYIFENLYPRTTGFIAFLPPGERLSSTSSYDLYDNTQYIQFKGGPHTASEGMIGKKLSEVFDKSNLYNTGSKRVSNLEIDGREGITLEFWLKKDSGIANQSPKQVIFDLHNDNLATASQGRFRVEIRPGLAQHQNNFWIEIRSGSSGVWTPSNGEDPNIPIGTGSADGSRYYLNLTSSDWNHYAVSAKNSGTQMKVELYVNGDLNHSILTGSSIDLISHQYSHL